VAVLFHQVYKLAGEIAGLDKETILLDVCCGTGTIGICLASKCKQVLGVDIVPQAIDDANANAERNGIQNAKFFAGKH
jgi:tRNA/tmRNA/rRNA uracil-C5-methylase (TrmA/RlmC/RlmD family)